MTTKTRSHHLQSQEAKQEEIVENYIIQDKGDLVHQEAEWSTEMDVALIDYFRNE